MESANFLITDDCLQSDELTHVVLEKQQGQTKFNLYCPLFLSRIKRVRDLLQVEHISFFWIRVTNSIRDPTVINIESCSSISPLLIIFLLDLSFSNSNLSLFIWVICMMYDSKKMKWMNNIIYNVELIINNKCVPLVVSDVVVSPYDSILFPI